MHISFVGLGKLGLPISSCLAKKNKVLGIDKNLELINKLKKDKIVFHEPGLNDLFKKNKNNFIDFNDSYENITELTDATFILVNTQDSEGGYSSKLVENVLEEISSEFKNSNKDYHLIILSSTVLPGTCDKMIKLIEEKSGKIYKENFGFVYLPDFVAIGNIINDFLKPDFFLIGANNVKDFRIVSKIFDGIHENKLEIKKLTIEETEIAKISFNAFVITKITFSNFLGLISKKLENVNINNITNCIGLSKRISPLFFQSGCPYGGACYPRDVDAFIKFCDSNNMDAKHLKFSEEVNEMLYDDIIKNLEKFNRIGILGISFKPNTSVLIGSPSVRLIKELKDKCSVINVYDRIEDSLIQLEDDVNKYQIPQKCIDNSDIVIIMHRDKYFIDFDYSKKEILDPWGLFS